MKWWWDGLTLAQGAQAQAQAMPHCIDPWLKENGWQFRFLLNEQYGAIDQR